MNQVKVLAKALTGIDSTNAAIIFEKHNNTFKFVEHVLMFQTSFPAIQGTR